MRRRVGDEKENASDIEGEKERGNARGCDVGEGGGGMVDGYSALVPAPAPVHGDAAGCMVRVSGQTRCGGCWYCKV